MADSNVVDFLRELKRRPQTLDELKTAPKEEVLAAAADFGLPFADADFNSVIWSLEERLAAARGEEFSGAFPLWRLLWGRYYLEFLVNDLIPSLTETKIIDGA
jgi:hypothetical protein